MTSLRQLRGDPSRSNLDDFYQWMQNVGAQFPIGFPSVSAFGNSGHDKQILPDATIESFRNIYRTNGIVFAVSAIRQRIFSEVTFRFTSISNGRNGRLFGTPDLSILENPWPGATTGELASRMMHDVNAAGNFYAVRPKDEAGVFTDRLYWRDPRKMSIVLNGDPLVDEFVDVIGYAYSPNGAVSDQFFYTVDEVCHWMPDPDPDSPYRGMSWITPVLREISSDNEATDYRGQFLRNGAVPNMVVTFPPDIMSETQFESFKEKMEKSYAGSRNSGKTLYLAPGADVTPVGKDFKELDFSETQGRDETRIASAGGVPAVIVGLKESLAGSSLNEGNFGAARRQLADVTMRPLYRSAAAALETVVPAPQANGASKLWYDDAGVAFFREDQADAATISATQAEMIRTYIIAGFVPDSVISAVEADDRTLLKHSGLFSVQLQEPGALNPKLNEPATDAPAIDPKANTLPVTAPEVP